MTPQNWLFLGTYAGLRVDLLTNRDWRFVARLGTRAFDSIGGEVVNVALIGISNCKANRKSQYLGVDASAASDATGKAATLSKGPAQVVLQAAQLVAPDARVGLESVPTGPQLSRYAQSLLGLGTGDAPHYIREYWEFDAVVGHWAFMQTAPPDSSPQAGRERVVAWDHAEKRIFGMTQGERAQAHNQDYRGREAWGKSGTAIALVGRLRSYAYFGELFDKSLAVLVSRSPLDTLAIRCFTEADSFSLEVRKLDQKMMVTNATLTKVAFDLAHWQKVAAETYPNGLPEAALRRPDAMAVQRSPERF